MISVSLILNLLSKIPGLLAGPVSQFFTGLNFASMLSGLWTSLKKYWRFYLPALLLILNLGTLYGWHGEHNNLVKEKAVHQIDINNFKQAQKDANDKAQAEKAIIQKESKANADQADASYSSLYAQYRAVLLRYNQQASAGAASSSSHNQLPPAQSSDGPGASTEVPAGSISITLDDANVCAINTARLQAVHDWALNPPKDDPGQ